MDARICTNSRRSMRLSDNMMNTSIYLHQLTENQVPRCLDANPSTHQRSHASTARPDFPRPFTLLHVMLLHLNCAVSCAVSSPPDIQLSNCPLRYLRFQGQDKSGHPFLLDPDDGERLGRQLARLGISRLHLEFIQPPIFSDITTELAGGKDVGSRHL